MSSLARDPVSALRTLRHTLSWGAAIIVFSFASAASPGSGAGGRAASVQVVIGEDGVPATVVADTPTYFDGATWRPIDTTVQRLTSTPQFDVTPRTVVSADGPKVFWDQRGDWTLANQSNLLETYFSGSIAEVRLGGSPGLVMTPEMLSHHRGAAVRTIGHASDADPIAVASSVSYNNVFRDVDVEYEVVAGGLHQRFVLAQPLALAKAPRGLQDRFAVDLRLSPGVSLADNQGRALQAGRHDGAFRMTVQEKALTVHGLSVTDAAGKSSPGSFNIGYRDDGSVGLSLEVAAAWLRSRERVYPITLDLDLGTTLVTVSTGR